MLNTCTYQDAKGTFMPSQSNSSSRTRDPNAFLKRRRKTYRGHGRTEPMEAGLTRFEGADA